MSRSTPIANLHRSANGLRTFVDRLHSNTETHIDPFNDFLCAFDFVKCSDNDDVSIIAKGLQQKLDTLAKKGITTTTYTSIDNDIHGYIEDLALPDVMMNGAAISLLHGKFNCANAMPMPVDNMFTMTVLNITPNPILETVFYPWMRALGGVNSENGENGRLDDLNYPRADFTVKFPHLSLDGAYYVYYNARPVNIETYKPSNKPAQKMYRNVTFTFDYFMIHEVVDVAEYAKDKILSAPPLPIIPNMYDPGGINDFNNSAGIMPA